MTLLDEVKLRLDVPGHDVSASRKIKSIVKDAKMHLREFHPLLTDEEFDNPSPARALAIAYSRYAYSNAEEEFDANYKEDLLALRQRYEVEAYVKSKEA
jgi:hypothetical protein